MCVCMCKPWNKMTKDEKAAHANHKIMKGLCILVFGVIWTFFASMSNNVWDALPLTLTVSGLLMFLYGMYKKSLC